MSASFFLSSGAKEIPFLTASTGELNLTGLSLIEINPPSSLSAPKISRESSVFPAPVRPVIPKTSPVKNILSFFPSFS